MQWKVTIQTNGFEESCLNWLVDSILWEQATRQLSKEILMVLLQKKVVGLQTLKSSKFCSLSQYVV